MQVKGISSACLEGVKLASLLTPGLLALVGAWLVWADLVGLQGAALLVKEVCSSRGCSSGKRSSIMSSRDWLTSSGVPTSGPSHSWNAQWETAGDASMAADIGKDHSQI